MLIYMATNKVNGKVYVGQTRKDLKDRINKHLINATNRPNDAPFYQAINKYGADNFEWEIIEDNVDSAEDLNEKERHYIRINDSLISGNGYNVRSGGEDHRKVGGEYHPQYYYIDVDRAIKLYHEGYSVPQVAEHMNIKKEKIYSELKQNGIKLRSLSEQNSISFSSMKGKNLEEIHGQKKADEIKKNTSQTLQGRTFSKETRQKLRENLLGMPGKKYKDNPTYKPIDTERIIELYKKGTSFTRLGEMFGVDKKKIKNELQYNGIPIRTPSEQRSISKQKGD